MFLQHLLGVQQAVGDFIRHDLLFGGVQPVLAGKSGQSKQSAHMWYSMKVCPVQSKRTLLFIVVRFTGLETASDIHVVARATKGDVTVVNLQRRFATHVFRTNLQTCYTFESLSKTSNALQHCKYRKKSSATGCYTRTIFRATSYHCKLALQVDQCNTTLKRAWQSQNCE